uniref:Uncharacterized protein n=1 Tax=Anopheles stephensi TaxID=30069 RepID=A0A182YT07_ANOST
MVFLLWAGKTILWGQTPTAAQCQGALGDRSRSPGSSAEDADLSLPATAVTSLDCEPAPLQCSPAQAQSECPDSSTSMQEQVSISEEKQSLLEGDLESGLQPQAPGSSTESSEPLSP